MLISFHLREHYPSREIVFMISWSVSQNMMGIVRLLSRIIVPTVSKLLKEHFIEFLEGGKFAPENNVSCSAKLHTTSVQMHNKFDEHVFAHTDRLLRFKPNISHLGTEAYLMFCPNKRDVWLSSKPRML